MFYFFGEFFFVFIFILTCLHISSLSLLPLVVVCVFSRHFRKISSFFFVLIPELFFMVCLFGYLVFMVVFKWIAYTPAQSKIAPSILIHFIDMFLFTENRENPPLYKGQVCDLFISLKWTYQCFNSCSTICLYFAQLPAILKHDIVFYIFLLRSWESLILFNFVSTVWKSHEVCWRHGTHHSEHLVCIILCRGYLIVPGYWRWNWFYLFILIIQN